MSFLGTLMMVLVACGDDGGGRPGSDAGRDGGAGVDVGVEPGPCREDGECDDGRFCNGDERCTAGECVAGAAPSCDDGEECTTDVCSEERRGCVHVGRDEDGDGHADAACAGDDCDDADPLRYTGAVELCDAANRDEDCNPATYGVQDLDGDGFVAATCCNGDVCGDDCDDMVAGVHPGLPEVCEGRDNDCDGRIDEEALERFWRDGDGDGYAADGDAVESVDACFAPRDFVADRGDCDDASFGIHPGAYDSCDRAMIDEDCNGTPNDPPAGCECTEGDTRPCPLPGACSSGRETCTGGTWSACSVTPVLESCNGADDDCDGMVDDGVGRTCWADRDRDGWAAVGATTSTACICPGGTTEREPIAPAIDCDDMNAARSPSVAEVCDGTDQDCDGMIDDGLPLVMAFRDVDLDGFFGTPTMACAGAPGTSPTNLDCADQDANVRPGQRRYFSVPYCTDGRRPCCDASVCGCGTDVVGSCFVTPTTSFDYDCDGAETPVPRTARRTCSALYCDPFGGAGSCAGSGYDYAPDLARCGVTQGWACYCTMFGGSMCVDGYPSERLPCR